MKMASNFLLSVGQSHHRRLRCTHHWHLMHSSTCARRSIQVYSGESMIQSPRIRQWARRVGVIACLLGFVFSIAVWWSSRLSLQELSLIGRWQGTRIAGDKTLTAFWELRSDRTCHAEFSIISENGSTPSKPMRITIHQGRWRVSHGQFYLQESLSIGIRMQIVFGKLTAGNGWSAFSPPSIGEVQLLNQDSFRMGEWTMHRMPDEPPPRA